VVHGGRKAGTRWPQTRDGSSAIAPVHFGCKLLAYSTPQDDKTHVRKLTQFVLAYLTGTAEPDGLTLPTALPGQVQRHPLHDYQGAILTLDGLTFGYSSVRVYTFHLLDRCATCGAWRTSNVPFRPGDLAQLGAFLEQPSWYGHPCRTEWTTTDDSEIPF
jgi:hypothetical protein